jgi:hypothetical protein
MSDQQAQITDLRKQLSEITGLLRHLSPKTDKAARHPDDTDPTPTAPHGDPSDLTRSAPNPGDSDSDSDPDSDPDFDLTAPDKPSTELLAVYLLQAMEPAQHSTTGSRHTTTASLLEAWHHKINPEARKALTEAVCSPGPAAAQALMTYQNELKAAIAPAKETRSAMTIAAITRDPDHQRALHTENLLAIACGCASMKHLKHETRKISETGTYNLDDLPDGPLDRTASFRKFLPSYNRSALWWQATLDLIVSFWGSAAAYCEDDLKAELAWRATNLPGNPKGTFARGEDSAATLIAREANLYRARETASRGKPFCIPMERAKNLLAAAGPELTEQFLNHLVVRELELDKLSWGNLTCELMKTDRANLDRRKTMGFLTCGIKTEPPDGSPAHKNRCPRPGSSPAPSDTADEEENCWNHMYLGTCEYESCSRKHPGPPGSKKHHLATPEGVCKRYLQGTCDRGDGCKFKHEQEPKANDPERLHREEILTRNKAAREAGHHVF